MGDAGLVELATLTLYSAIISCQRAGAEIQVWRICRLCAVYATIEKVIRISANYHDAKHPTDSETMIPS
jgi:hypothetical protein